MTHARSCFLRLAITTAALVPLACGDSPRDASREVPGDVRGDADATPDGVADARTAGYVTFVGRQDAVYETGPATASLDLAALASMSNLYALGAATGLDGEITILDSEPFVSRVRGPAGEYIVERAPDASAIFLVWAELTQFREVPVPASVTDYAELERFVRDAAERHAIPTDQPIAFLLRGTPPEIAWHINVDRTGGRPLDRDLFRQSKQRYTLHDEQVEIFGVYSEHHGGIFMTEGSRSHLHFASRDSQATGHVDGIVPGGALTLLLPVREE